jgi:deoxyadenosine/deoxycytidine kinase
LSVNHRKSTAEGCQIGQSSQSQQVVQHLIILVADHILKVSVDQQQMDNYQQIGQSMTKDLIDIQIPKLAGD